MLYYVDWLLGIHFYRATTLDERNLNEEGAKIPRNSHAHTNIVNFVCVLELKIFYLFKFFNRIAGKRVMKDLVQVEDCNAISLHGFKCVRAINSHI